MSTTKITSIAILFFALFSFTSMGYAAPVTEDKRHSEWETGITHFPAVDNNAPANDMGFASRNEVPSTEDMRHAEWNLGITHFSSDAQAPVSGRGLGVKHETPVTEDTRHMDWEMGITRF